MSAVRGRKSPPETSQGGSDRVVRFRPVWIRKESRPARMDARVRQAAKSRTTWRARMPCGSREQLATAVLAWMLACTLAAPGIPARAQDPADSKPVVRPIYYNSRSFRIPVTVQPEGREVVREVRLWVSETTGTTGRSSARPAPTGPSSPSAPAGTPSTGSPSRPSTSRAESTRPTTARRNPP